jgi:predicted RNA-binding Zn-ribbon protein involved in translation (DUF1610 family)
MPPLSAMDLLTLWDSGAGLDSTGRALAVLSACCHDPSERLAALGIGERDARLLDVYENLFGPKLEAFAECPGCGERLEYELSVLECKASRPAADQDSGSLEFSVRGVALRLRHLNSLDLSAASACSDPARARRLLAERSVVGASRDGIAVDPADLPDEAVAEISAHLAQSDPRAESTVDLQCPACGKMMQQLLAIEDFLWSKLSALCKRLLFEVDALARAYGWSEAEILSMSAARRGKYLELALS